MLKTFSLQDIQNRKPFQSVRKGPESSEIHQSVTFNQEIITLAAQNNLPTPIVTTEMLYYSNNFTNKNITGNHPFSNLKNFSWGKHCQTNGDPYFNRFKGLPASIDLPCNFNMEICFLGILRKKIFPKKLNDRFPLPIVSNVYCSKKHILYYFSVFLSLNYFCSSKINDRKIFLRAEFFITKTKKNASMICMTELR